MYSKNIQSQDTLFDLSINYLGWMSSNLSIYLLGSVLIISSLAILLNLKNSKKIFNKTLYTIIFVTLSLMLLIYGLEIFIYAYKFYKLTQVLYMENDSDSNSKKHTSSSKRKSPKQSSTSSFGGNDSDDSDKTSKSKKRKRHDNEENIFKPSKKVKTEISLESENDSNSDSDANSDVWDDSYFKDNNESPLEKNNDSNENIINKKTSPTDSTTSDGENEPIPSADKGKGRYVAGAEQDVFVDVPSDYDAPSSWLNDEELDTIKEEAKEFVKVSNYQVYLEVDNNENGQFLLATHNFQNFLEDIRGMDQIPLAVKDCIYSCARDLVYWAEVVECFEDKYRDLPID